MHVAYGRHSGQLLVLVSLQTHHPIVWVFPMLTVCLCLYSFSYEDTRHWSVREPPLLHRAKLHLQCLFPHEALSHRYQGLGLHVSFWKRISPHSSCVVRRTFPLGCYSQEPNPIKSRLSASTSSGFSLYLKSSCIFFWYCVCLLLRLEPKPHTC